MLTLKRTIISILCGLIILLVTWKYQNYDYTLKLEDEFFKKVFWVKDKIYSPPPKKSASFIFINTGKDLALVEDSIDYGNIAISDRDKILQLLKNINAMKVKPAYCVLDIQFYYPYTVNPQTDTLMQLEINKDSNILLPILRAGKGAFRPPLYTSTYGHSEYRTFSTNFNKFRIILDENLKSIPLVMHEKINNAKYEDGILIPTCNDSLCLTAIWPTYYLKDNEIKKSMSGESIQDIEENAKKKKKMQRVPVDYYNLGELLFDMEANPETYSNAFSDKIVIVGNFQEDVHTTPVGKMTGPVLLANLYLSLLNNQHIMNYWLLVLLLVTLSSLSYIAIFKKMPEVKINFKFLFSSYLSKFMRDYISYFGAMFLVSLLAVILFNVQVALFLPSLIFTGIVYIKEKKYLELKK